jgi:hypothetical protein
MTRYTVVWDEDVEVPFTNAWIESDSQTRAVLTEVANWIDGSLAESPDIKGRPGSESSTRIMNVPLFTSSAHISVTYQVWQDDRKVRVMRLVFRAK